MVKFVGGAIAGCIVTLVALSLFAGLFNVPAERKLIADWRRVKQGMARAEVEKLLGSPDHCLEPGAGFPSWAGQSVPDDYYLDHGLLVFTVRRMGPQLLLVFVDEDGRVAFVSSTFS